MQKFEGCVVLTRVGGFYEVRRQYLGYCQQVLTIVIAISRPRRQVWPTAQSQSRQEEDHSWSSVHGLYCRNVVQFLLLSNSQAGFPCFQLDRFLKILVQELNESVAISEEFAHNAFNKVKSGGPLFDRKVMRVVTPGTLIDENFINPYENNYLLAITTTAVEPNLEKKDTITQSATRADNPFDGSRRFGLAWLDLSTGDFYTQIATAGSLPSALARIGAREIVLNKSVAPFTHQLLNGILDLQRHLITYHRARGVDLPISEWTPMLVAAVSPETQRDFTPEEVAAGSLLLGYANEKLQGVSMRLQPPIRMQDKENMRIDKNSLRGLEVLETSKDGIGGGKGTLLHSIRRTVTRGGTRLLKTWLGTKALACILRLQKSCDLGNLLGRRRLTLINSFTVSFVGDHQRST